MDCVSCSLHQTTEPAFKVETFQEVDSIFYLSKYLKMVNMITLKYKVQKSETLLLYGSTNTICIKVPVFWIILIMANV